MLKWIINTVCLTLLLGTLTVGSLAQANPLLDNHRWQEYSYGVSILPPLGGSVHKQSADQAILRITMPDGYAINLFIKKSTVQINLPTVRSQALEQMAGAYPSATVLSDMNQTVNKRDQMALHFFLPRTQQGPWVTAQTFIQLSPQVFVLFQLETPKNLYELAKPTYDAVVRSMQVSDPRLLLAEREKLLDAGHTLLKQVNYKQFVKQLIPEQWLRFVEGDRDIGYMRIRQSYGRLDDRKEKMPAYIERFG
ncbi:MAG: hypothetical protein JKX85_15575, partial [Phycisphaeraceae bacterium]|nr:hypothetical protein [Phycisphaeraceae bacterium]